MTTLRVGNDHFEAETLQNGRKIRIFHPGDTVSVCPKQGFTGVSDSKTRGKTDFLRYFKLTGVKSGFSVPFLMALHGPKCERGKKFLKRWGFLGVRAEESGRFTGEVLIYVNVFLKAGRVERMAFMTTNKGCPSCPCCRQKIKRQPRQLRQPRQQQKELF